MLTWILMCLKLTYHIQLTNFSYANQYVDNYNNFIPTLLGKNSPVFDIFIRSLLKGSKYDNPLWFMVVYFWGSLFVEQIEKISLSFNKKIFLYILLYITFLKLEIIDWKMPYVSYIIAGVVCGKLHELFHEKFLEIEFKQLITVLLFLVGLYIIAPNEYIGFYLPLSMFSCVNTHLLKTIGVFSFFISVDLNENLQKFFKYGIAQWLNKYSIGIYALHWSVVISLSCGVTYLLHVVCCLNYMISGFIGILIGTVATLIISKIFVDKIYRNVTMFFMNTFSKFIKID